MKIVISGGTGFLGHPLRHALANAGHEVVVLTRGAARADRLGRFVSWQPAQPGGAWRSEIDGSDAVVNLAGEGIADGRWTTSRKAALRASRLLGTRALVEAIRSATHRPSMLLSGSAIGFYGDGGEIVKDESSPPGRDFLAALCVEWEAAAREAEALGCRVVLLRTGVVLAREGGALKKMLPAFRLFAGGPLASGRQYLSWIHREDWGRLAMFAIETNGLRGPINATAPVPVTNAEFSRALGRALHRPSWLRVPGVALRVLLGEMADVALIDGQRVVPRRALDAGFEFTYREIGQALEQILSA